MGLDNPKLIYAFKVERKPSVRRFMWMLLAFVASVSAWVALDEIIGRGEDVDPRLLDAGQTIAIILAIILGIRALIHLVRAIRTKTQSAQFFDRGFRWQYGKREPNKYSWSQLNTFREGGRVITFFNRPILQFGAHVLTMRDGKRYRFSARHGDMRRFAKVVRPIVADITGTRMAQALRNKKKVRIHADLIIQAGGIVAGKHKIRWSDVDLTTTKTKLTVSKKDKNGQFKSVKTYRIRDLDNLAGFLDIAHSTMRNHQPERFNIKTYGMA